MLPNYTVVLSVYRADNPRQFREALDSIITQTVPASQIIVVVDGPVPPELAQAVKGYEGQASIDVLWLPANLGRGGARHEAVLRARFDIVGIMDSDDFCVARRFEWQLPALANADVVGGQIAEFECDPKRLERTRRVPLAHDEIVQRGRWLLPVNHVTIVFRKESYLRVGGYRSLRKVEDYDLFHRLVIAGARFANISEVVVLVRTSPEQYSRRQGWSYFSEELSLYRSMREAGYITRLEMVRNVSIRIIIRFIPTLLFASISRRILRRPIHSSV